jgi:hypothetical protein
MSMQVFVGDRTGRIIDQIHPHIENVAWRLNEVASIDVQMAKSDPKATETNFRYGNRLLIKFSDDVGLPYWGGVIDMPAVWDESSVTVTAYTLEFLLKYRQTQKTRAFIDQVVGRIYWKILTEANQLQPLGLRFGPIWTGGRPHSPKYHFEDAWSIIQNSILKLETCDVRFVAQQDGNFIRFRAELHEKAGEDKSTKYAFKEGANVSRARYSEQGPIINEFTAAGAGTNWTDKKHETAYSRASDQKYGLRQDSRVMPGVTLPVTLTRAAHTEVKTNAEPHTRIELTVSNSSPAKFANYDLGDVIGCVLPSYGWNGFDAPVRVLAREYHPTGGDCKLVVEEDKFIGPINIGWRADRTE